MQMFRETEVLDAIVVHQAINFRERKPRVAGSEAIKGHEPLGR